jgi:hypothetical protein
MIQYQWARLADMPTASSHFEGNVVVANGRDPGPRRAVWTVHTPLPEKRKAGFSYAASGIIHYGAGDSYHNGQPQTTMIAKLPRTVRTQSLASSTGPSSALFSTTVIANDDDLLALI